MALLSISFWLDHQLNEHTGDEQQQGNREQALWGIHCMERARGLCQQRRCGQTACDEAKPYSKASLAVTHESLQKQSNNAESDASGQTNLSQRGRPSDCHQPTCRPAWEILMISIIKWSFFPSFNILAIIVSVFSMAQITPLLMASYIFSVW